MKDLSKFKFFLTIITLFAVAGLAQAQVTINLVGGGTGWDTTNEVQAQAWRSTSVDKGTLGVEVADAFGAAGSWFAVAGTPAPSGTDNSPTWASNFTTPAGALFPGILSARKDHDNPNLAIGATVADWTSTSWVGPDQAANGFHDILSFDITAGAPSKFRLGAMGGFEGGNWVVNGYNLSFDGGAVVQVTGIPAGTVGWVFWDITTDGATGTFTIQSQGTDAGNKGGHLAGVTFDRLPFTTNSMLLLEQSTLSMALNAPDSVTNDTIVATHLVGTSASNDVEILSLVASNGFSAAWATTNILSVTNWSEDIIVTYTNAGTLVNHGDVTNSQLIVTWTAQGSSVTNTTNAVLGVTYNNPPPELQLGQNALSLELYAPDTSTSGTIVASHIITQFASNNIDIVSIVASNGFSATVVSNTLGVANATEDIIVTYTNAGALVNNGDVTNSTLVVSWTVQGSSVTNSTNAVLDVTYYDPVVLAGDVISIDFGGTPPATPNWNQYSSTAVSNLVRRSDGLGTGVDIEVTSVGAINPSGGSNLEGSGSSDSTIYGDHIFANDGAGDTLIFTISGLDSNLVYTLFGGYRRELVAFEGIWTVGTDVRTNLHTDGFVDGYETFIKLPAPGGIITFTISDVDNADRADISELTITAIEPSTNSALELLQTTLSMDLYAPNSTANGSITVAFFAGTSTSNDIDIISLVASNGFSAVASNALGLANTSEDIIVTFTNSVGLLSGGTTNSLLEVKWTEQGSSVTNTTNAVLDVTYYADPPELQLDQSTLSLILNAPGTVTNGTIDALYVAPQVQDNIDIVSIVASNGFSASVVSTNLNTGNTNEVITVTYTNAGALVNHGDVTNSTLVVSWTVQGSSVTNTTNADLDVTYDNLVPIPDLLVVYDFVGGSSAATTNHPNVTASVFSLIAANLGFHATIGDNTGVAYGGEILGTDGVANGAVTVPVSVTTKNTFIDALADDVYVEFTVTPVGGRFLSLTSISFKSGRKASASIDWFGLTDDTGTQIGSSWQNPTVTSVTGPFNAVLFVLSAPEFQNIKTAITFRIYMWGAGTTTTTNTLAGMDKVVLRGKVLPASTTIMVQ